jgi:GxxExxY protein
MSETSLVYKELSEKIIGAFYEVHRELGRGHSEQVYCEALAIEFGLQGIPFRCEETFRILYKGHLLKSYFKADFIVFDKILVEVKAIDQLTRSNLRQAINYLASSKEKLCLLVNFGAENLEFKRVVL